jgi:hypothetical protein
LRPAGEVRLALLEAATRLTSPDPTARGATMQEMATSARVGYSAALHTTKNLKRAGALCITGRRKVPGRNKLVAEYKPADMVPPQDHEGDAPPDFTALASAWK